MSYAEPGQEVKYAIYNNKGERITGYEYDYVKPFQGDYAAAEQGLTSLMIDETGHATSAWPTVEGIGQLEICNDRLYADVDNQLKYITAQGDIIWQGEYMYELGGKAVLKEAKYRPDRYTVSYYPVIEGLADPEIQNRINERFKTENLAEMNEISDIFDPEFDGRLDYESYFSVHMHEKDLLVINFSSYSYSGGPHGMPGERFLHVNLQSGTAYQLSDLFKPQSGYMDEINRIVAKQIEEEGEEKGVYDSDPEAAAYFEGIREDQSFNIDRDTLHITFAPYEIGPYSSGFITFDIPFTDMDHVLDKDGEFWRSFH